MTSQTLGSLILSGSMAMAAGLVGAFALMRRMTLAADALSHVALPGIGVAILLRMNPLLGALAALFAGALLAWGLEMRTRLATETLIGVLFSSALALGALLTPGEELIDALFGGPGSLSGWELATGVTCAVGVIAFVLRARHGLILTLVSADLARTAGVNVRRLDLAFLVAFALVVAFGLRYLGVLLMGSLIIIPPATARQFARNLTSMLVSSAALALLATLAGTWLALRYHRPTGPFIVVVAVVCFGTALMIPRATLPPRRPASSVS